MNLLKMLYGERGESLSADEIKKRNMRVFYDAVFLIGWLVCLPAGALLQYNTILSLVLLCCIMVSFFDDNFYLYAALFMFMRYRMVIGDEMVFRLYSFMVVFKLILELPKIKIRVSYLPALFVFVLHSVFAVTRVEGIHGAVYVIVEVLFVYTILLRVLVDANLFRKFLFVFLLGAVASGMYGWLNSDVSVDINVKGAGVHTVNRNFGALSDANFAGLFYSLSVIISLVLKNIPKWLRVVFVAIFAVLLLQTASLSAMITLSVLSVFVIILKYRGRSFFILLFGFVAVVAVVSALLSIPQFRQIDAIQGLIIRITEKLSYIPRGRWDLLTTDRWDLWGQALAIFKSKNIWGQLFGGSVITVLITEPGINFAIHNSYIQGLLNYGVLGSMLVYLPLFSIFGFRVLNHFTKPERYETEDVKILQLTLMFAFIVFGATVDFFVDWPFLMFYFA